MLIRLAIGLCLLGILGAAIVWFSPWQPFAAMLAGATLPFFGAMLALSRWAQGLAPD